MPEKLAPKNYLEERFLDYHLIKRENQILREENRLLRNEVLKRTTKMEQTPMVELMGLQRLRIDNLEREYDSLVNQMYDIKEVHINKQSQAIDM